MSIIKLKDVSKFYSSKGTIASGFSKINLELNSGEFVVITGESGSGKSTLLNVISGLDSYEEGEMYINGEETSHYNEEDYEKYRRKYIGNIFQNFNLVNSYTVYQNIELVLLLNGYQKKEAKNKVYEVLKQVGLEEFKNTKASKLSGGQKQRVAIARALVKDTPIIVADEPTGNLDVKSAEEVLKLLYEVSKDKLVVVVTHNYEQIEKYATRKITMHDGKITVDKKLKETSEVKLKEGNFKNLKRFYRWLLGIRNSFNIKTKFLLLLIIYLVLTLFVFSSYSAMQKMVYDNGSIGVHPLFKDVSDNRIIINKTNKKVITDDDFEKIKSISNIKSVVKDDLILDNNYALESDNNYYGGKIRSISEIEKVDEGAMPKKDNEIVIETLKAYFDPDTFKNEYKLFDMEAYGNDLDHIKVKITGVIYGNSSDSEDIIYVNDNVLKTIRKGVNQKYSNIEITLNDNIYTDNDSRLSFEIIPNKNVKEKTALVNENMHMYCSKQWCINKDLKLKVSNIYYTDILNSTINQTYNKNNFNARTGLSRDMYDLYVDAIFVNPNDYDKLFNKDTYQASVFLKDTKESSNTLNELKKLGYNTYYMRDMMKEMNEGINGIIKVFRTIVFVVALVVLFFISYFIIKLILKSRNSYFSTIRTLGATRKVASSLLNIELFIDINVAYLMFISLIMLVNKNIIKSNYIKDMITYFTLRDYIIIYIVLIILSLLISSRYSRKLFKDSVMSAYREEV